MSDFFPCLFQEIEAGWVLNVPTQKGDVMHAVVLRIKEENGERLFWLSQFSTTDELSTVPLFSNPHRYNSSKRSVFDNRNQVPSWYGTLWTFEREGGESTVKKYESIPRLEHLLSSLGELTSRPFEETIDEFESSPLVIQAIGVLQNGEAGDRWTQLALILEILGIESTRERVGAFAYVIACLLSGEEPPIILIPTASLSETVVFEERGPEGHTIQ